MDHSSKPTAPIGVRPKKGVSSSKKEGLSIFLGAHLPWGQRETECHASIGEVAMAYVIVWVVDHGRLPLALVVGVLDQRRRPRPTANLITSRVS